MSDLIDADVPVIAPEDLFQHAAGLKKDGYRILSVLSAYDLGEEMGVFYAVVKPANTPEEFADARFRVHLPKEDNVRVPSLVDIFPAAGWHEREMYDMYGIQFEGNPDLRRMFLPEGWKGFPMRKEYKEPEQFVMMEDGEDVVVPTEQEGAW